MNLTSNIEPFVYLTRNDHVLIVLAAYWEVECGEGTGLQYSNPTDAYRMAQKLHVRGLDCSVDIRIVDAIDLTAARNADFGDTDDARALAEYRTSWCGRVDQTLPRRQPEPRNEAA